MSVTSLLSGFDFRAIEEMDPSIADGYRIIYDRDVPFELRLEEGSGALEAIKVKVRLRKWNLPPQISCLSMYGLRVPMAGFGVRR